MSFEFVSASLTLTEDCDLKCTYCFEEHCKNKMSLEVAQKSIDFLIGQAKEMGHNNIDINFFGGEPLLNFEVLEATMKYGFEKCRENQLQFIPSIITNCTIFPEGYADLIKYWFQQSGQLRIQLSIDGIPTVQDKNRVYKDGRGSSKVVEETLKKYITVIEELNEPINKHLKIHSVLTSESIPYMVESYLYFINLGVEKIWYILRQEEKWTDETVELYRKNLTEISNIIFDKIKTTGDIRYLYNDSSLSKCLTTHPKTPCSAGRNYCNISTEGDIYPCHVFYFTDKDTKIGNIYTGINESHRNIYTEYDINSLFGDKPCSECSNAACYRCIGFNYAHNKSIFIGFPDYCKISRVEDEVRFKLFSRLVNELGIIRDDLSRYLNIKNNVVQTLDNQHDVNCKSQQIDINGFVKHIDERLNIIDEKINVILDSMLVLLKMNEGGLEDDNND